VNYFSINASGGQGGSFVMLERTVICHWSFVIGEKNNIQKQPLIGRGCQPPAPLDPQQKLLIKKKVPKDNLDIY
jgi:hypothetical protein